MAMFYRKLEHLKCGFLAVFSAMYFTTTTHAAPLFDGNSILEMELHGPRQELVKKRKQENDWPFRLITDASAQNVQIRARGNSRLRICKLPPLRVEFDGVENQQTAFDGLKKLKLVVPCRNGEAAQSNVLEEYLAYRIFNFISENSYRVRLFRVTFVDAMERKKAENEVVFGFAIEPRQIFADRVGANAVDVSGVSVASLNRQHMAKVYIFQYLIGNTDWSLVTADGDDVCCHNGELVDINSERFYIPYDFDLSGIVNASYAYPDASLSISKVTRRLYRGFCMQREELQTALTDINDKKSDILQELSALSGMEEKEKTKTRKFLEAFFEQAENETKLLDNFERRCL